MEHIKRIGAGFLDTMGANRNKPPPDDLLVSCKGQLATLRDEIMLVKQQFSQYAHQVVEASEASVTLSKSVGNFYSRANHPGRSESVNMYKKAQEDIANNAVNTLHTTVDSGLVFELAEWLQLVANLTEKIQNAESTRISAHDTQNRLISLQNEYQDKKSKKQGLFGGNRENELDTIQQRIAECKEAQKSLTLEYQKARANIAQQVKQLMEKRYRYFDRIYVQMLECQAEYFQHAATVSKRFQRDIDYYRRQYPKTKDFSNSSGSLHKLAEKIQSETAAQQSKTSTIQAVSTPPHADDIVISATSKPKPPVGPPPDAPTQSQSESQTVTNTNSTSQSPSDSNASSGKSSPVQVQSNATSNNNNLDVNNGAQAAQKAPQVQHRMASNGHNQQNQQSTHDILNLHGPPMKSPPPPKPKKQESFMTAMFGKVEDKPQKRGSGQGGGGQEEHHDPHGIFNLANPDHNDMLHGFTYDQKESAQNAPAQSNAKPQNAAATHDDIFGDFMSFGGDAKGNKDLAHHGSVDSTSDWLLASHNPAQAPKKQPQGRGRKATLEQQMNSNFNQPSYGGGHNESSNNHHSDAHKSPSIQNSTTHKVGKNGTAANAQQQLSNKDKEQMAKMQLSDQGRINAEKSYAKAMAERQAQVRAAQDEHKEKLYYKGEHEKKLNEWEFDNGVRRNVRTLIGKLPDVLPANLKWKPIPMTKLLNDAQLKKGYYKAVRIVHPDKSIGRGDSVENQVICDFVFQALEQAFNVKFG
eukprot:39926_1